MNPPTPVVCVEVVVDPIVLAYAARWALEQRSPACADMARTVVRHVGALAATGHAQALIEAIDAWLEHLDELADPLAVGDAGDWTIARDALIRALLSPYGHMWREIVAGHAIGHRTRIGEHTAA